MDYGLGRYDVLSYFEDVEAQTRLCADLIFWMRCADDSDAAREWGGTLVDLLQAQGKGREAAQAMFRQGRALIFDKEYEESANILRQAFLLAERLDDSELSASCEQFLQYTDFFLR
jgi:hypothetical protein